MNKAQRSERENLLKLLFDLNNNYNVWHDSVAQSAQSNDPESVIAKGDVIIDKLQSHLAEADKKD